MARVVITLEDTTAGRFDGAVTFRMTFEPGIESGVALKELTAAQQQAIAVREFMQIAYGETEGGETRITTEPAE